MPKFIKTNLQIIALIVILLPGCGQEPSQTTKQANDNNALNPLDAEITVYKSPSCGCCAEWVTYLQEEGFTVSSIDHDNVDDIKTRFGIPDPELYSCHTAIVDGYIIEGHVPANDITRLLTEAPADIKGLTAPGMPMKSPGMASRIPKDYAVLSFSESGETSVYSQY